MTKLEKANRYQEQNRIDQREKPIFHVTAPVGWMNDPNGFSIYQGRIHLFYQYHPYSSVWGPMHWGHFVSDDFVKWVELPVALAPDSDYDAAGCFSGSAIETEEGHVLVYTGVMESEREDGSKEVIQHQCLAIGNGIQYEKISDNPVIPVSQLPEGLSGKDFRDPKIWKEENNYYLVACSRDAQKNGRVLLFTSENCRDWRYLSELAANRGKYGKMWECPDFFFLDEKQVLIVSPMDMQADGQEFHNGKQSMAMIGEYDRQKDHFREEQVVSLDYGMDFYAPQTLLTEDGRRIMIAWMQSWDMMIKPEEQKWYGMMTIPRQIELRNGILYQNPIKELEQYHSDAVICEGMELSGETAVSGVRGRVLDLTMELLSGNYKEFTISFAKNESYVTSFRYDRASQKIEFDRTYSDMTRDAVSKRAMKIKKPEKTLKLRMLFDRFSVELFVNDGAQVFSATYYTPLDAKDIVFTCDGTVVVNVEKYEIQLDKGERN